MICRATEIRASDIAEFRKQGVVCIRKALDSDEIAELTSTIDAVVASLEQSKTGYDVTSIADYTFGGDASFDAKSAVQYDIPRFKEFLQENKARRLRDELPAGIDHRGHFFLDTTTWLRYEGIRRIALDSALPLIAAQLMESNKVNYFDDQVFVKQPFTDQRTGMHQDYPYFHCEGYQGCVMWVCVDPAGPESGTPAYLPGSHRNHVFKPGSFFADLSFPDCEDGGIDISQFESQVDRALLKAFAVEPGDAIVHDFRTLHEAGGNLTALPRRALSVRYCGDDMRYRHRQDAPKQPYPPHGLKDGDVLDSEQFPVVWPRPFPHFAIAPLYNGRAGEPDYER